MEMNDSVSGNCNLLGKIKKSIEEIEDWTWSDLLVALKHCQNLQQVAASSGVLERCLDSLVARLVTNNEASPCASTSSPDSPQFRLSCDTTSVENSKHGFSRAAWWFEDLSVLNPNMIEMMIKSMVSKMYDNVIIGRFLVYYQKSKFYNASSDEKHKVSETVIDMLHILDPNYISCRSLFGILRVVLNLNISKSSRSKLESMIGSQLDQATLDNLLIPSPHGTSHLYDVNLVLKFLKAFRKLSPIRTKKVGTLIDMYIAEVAPDPCLKPSKFLALITALPDSARDSCDKLYHAMDMYLEVHAGLCEEEKKICCALNYEKLSMEACIHLSQNAKFRSKSSVQALSYRLKGTNYSENKGKAKKDEAGEQVVVYSRKLETSLSADNEKLIEHLQGMQCRVMELEEVCKKMETQMAKFMKSKAAAANATPRLMPRFCS